VRAAPPDRNLRTTAQFVSKIFYPDRTKPFLFCSDALVNYGFSDDKYNFFADNVSVELSEDGTSYHVKSAVNEDCMVDVKISQKAPGFDVGKDGTSYYGTDPEAPWGKMMHSFWPRCKFEGKCFTKDGEIDMGGEGLYIHALQGMKPHHAGGSIQSRRKQCGSWTRC
jgi:hypothetical protein